MRRCLNRAVWAFAFFCLAIAAPALANDGRWRRAESEHFIVFSDGSEAGLREATQTLEDFHVALERLTNTANEDDAGVKLEVYLLADRSGLRVLVPGIDPGVLGFYTTSTEHMAAFLVYSNNFDIDAREVLLHEYAHHFMLHRFPAAYPRWYVEGWAEFVSTAEIRDRRAIIGAPSTRVNWLIQTTGPPQATRSRLRPFNVELLPVEQLLAPERFSDLQDRPEFVGHFYATAWLAASLIANRDDLERGLGNYVRALGDGGDPLESFEPAFGMSPEAFSAAMSAHVRGTGQLVAVQLPPTRASVEITRLPASMNDVLLRVARMKLRIGVDANTDDIADVVNRALARNPEDAFVQRAAARVALLSNDTGRARSLLEPVVAANGDDAEALLLLGLTYIADATREGETNAAIEEAIRNARRHWARGFRADPNYFPILYLYALSFSGGPEPLTSEQLDVMARALYLAPQAEEIRFAYAEQLFRAARFEESAEALRPLLHTPHDKIAQNRARTMFEAARQRLN